MNVENIKSELQQVLESDIALRKEYNEVKRSLSDYRNQLIQRDEDCKRLQVSIDVLNTKLVVMERDNIHYKQEVTSFQELRNGIREQLNEKQEEINTLLNKIETLTNQLTSISSDYEAQIATLQSTSSEEIAALTANYEAQISELKINTSYLQSGIRNELELKINSLTSSYNETYKETVASYESQIEQLKTEYTEQLEKLKLESESQISSLTETNAETVGRLTNEYDLKVNGLTFQWQTEREELISLHHSQVSSLTEFFSVEKSELISSYDSTIADLNAQLANKQVEFETELTSAIEILTISFTQKENELREFYEHELSTTTSTSGSLLETLKSEYEEKLSNTVIHSNIQNSKLSEDMSKIVMENEDFKEKIRDMVYHIDAQNAQIETLHKDLEMKSEEIHKQLEHYQTLSSEFDTYKASQLASIDEQVSALNLKITELDTLLSQKDILIHDLTVFRDEKENQATSLSHSYNELQEQFKLLSLAYGIDKETFENAKNELELIHSQQLQSKEVEFTKLLAENTSLISEIDTTSDKLEVTEEELSLIKAELAELKVVAESRVEDLKDTLNSKNYEITALSANNVALQTELDLLKAELEHINGHLRSSEQAHEVALAQQDHFDVLMNTKQELENQLAVYQTSIQALNEKVAELTGSVSHYEVELHQLKVSAKTDEQDAFIDRLFKQIDLLSDERLNLLNEKEEMANQLLKMNETVSNISQHVDSHNIDITELDNHRKNVILAKSSSNEGVSEKTVMKKQINELVREIDKCIALLSA